MNLLEILPTKDVHRIKDIVETWNFKKVHNREFNRVDMFRFIQDMNATTRMLISCLGETETKFYLDFANRAHNVIEMLAPSQPAMDGQTTYEARKLIQIFEVNEVDFYTGLMELAVHACTLTTAGAKVIGDGVDRTGL